MTWPISKEFWKKTVGKKKFSIAIGKKKINWIVETYAEGKRRDLIAYFGSSDYLEIAMVNNNAAKHLKVITDSPIIIPI